MTSESWQRTRSTSGTRSTRGPRRMWVAALLTAALATAATILATTPLAAQAIVGGSAAAPGEFGFMVSVQAADRTGSDAHFCGGSVLRKRLVLTAAHCVTGNEPRDLRLVVGAHHLDSRQGTTYAVDKIVIHPRYAETGTHDVALLRTTRPITGARIPVVAAGNDAFERNGARLTVTGWGTTFFLLGPPSTVLRKVDVQAVSDSGCLLNGLMGFRPRTEMCAQTLLGDSCQGDSGGPLFGRRANGRPVQVGVVSYGLGCATPLFPGVYAELNSPAIRSFLVDTVKSEAAAIRKAQRRSSAARRNR